MDISHYEENTVELNYRIAKLIYHLGDYTYAEKFAQKAIDLDHRFSPAYRLKGEIYLKMVLMKSNYSFKRLLNIT